MATTTVSAPIANVAPVFANAGTIDGLRAGVPLRRDHAESEFITAHAADNTIPVAVIDNKALDVTFQPETQVTRRQVQFGSYSVTPAMGRGTKIFDVPLCSSYMSRLVPGSDQLKLNTFQRITWHCKLALEAVATTAGAIILVAYPGNTNSRLIEDQTEFNNLVGAQKVQILKVGTANEIEMELPHASRWDTTLMRSSLTASYGVDSWGRYDTWRVAAFIYAPFWRKHSLGFWVTPQVSQGFLTQGSVSFQADVPSGTSSDISSGSSSIAQKTGGMIQAAASAVGAVADMVENPIGTAVKVIGGLLSKAGAASTTFRLADAGSTVNTFATGDVVETVVLGAQPTDSVPPFLPPLPEEMRWNDATYLMGRKIDYDPVTFNSATPSGTILAQHPLDVNSFGSHALHAFYKFGRMDMMLNFSFIKSRMDQGRFTLVVFPTDYIPPATGEWWNNFPHSVMSVSSESDYYTRLPYLNQEMQTQMFPLTTNERPAFAMFSWAIVMDGGFGASVDTEEVIQSATLVISHSFVNISLTGPSDSPWVFQAPATLTVGQELKPFGDISQIARTGFAQSDIGQLVSKLSLLQPSAFTITESPGTYQAVELIIPFPFTTGQWTHFTSPLEFCIQHAEFMTGSLRLDFFSPTGVSENASVLAMVFYQGQRGYSSIKDKLTTVNHRADFPTAMPDTDPIWTSVGAAIGVAPATPFVLMNLKPGQTQPLMIPLYAGSSVVDLGESQHLRGAKIFGNNPRFFVYLRLISSSNSWGTITHNLGEKTSNFFPTTPVFIGAGPETKFFGFHGGPYSGVDPFPLPITGPIPVPASGFQAPSQAVLELSESSNEQDYAAHMHFVHSVGSLKFPTPSNRVTCPHCLALLRTTTYARHMENSHVESYLCICGSRTHKADSCPARRVYICSLCANHTTGLIAMHKHFTHSHPEQSAVLASGIPESPEFGNWRCMICSIVRRDVRRDAAALHVAHQHSDVLVELYSRSPLLFGQVALDHLEILPDSIPESGFQMNFLFGDGSVGVTDAATNISALVDTFRHDYRTGEDPLTRVADSMDRIAASSETAAKSTTTAVERMDELVTQIMGLPEQVQTAFSKGSSTQQASFLSDTAALFKGDVDMTKFITNYGQGMVTCVTTVVSEFSNYQAILELCQIKGDYTQLASYLLRTIFKLVLQRTSGILGRRLTEFRKAISDAVSGFQSGVEVSVILKIMGVLYALADKKIPPTQIWGMIRSTDAVIELVTDAFGCLKYWVTGKKSASQLEKEAADIFEDFVTDYLDAFITCQCELEGSARGSAKAIGIARQLRAKVLEMRPIIGSLGPRYRPTVSGLISRAVDMITKTQERAAAVQRATTRMLLLSGDSQIGKTSVLGKAVLQRLAAFLGLPYESVAFSYNGLDTFPFEGYEHNPVLVMDDLGQDAKQADLKMLPNLISSAPYPIPRADLIDKGQYFTSPIILASTNSDLRTGISCVRSPMAIIQRTHRHHYKVRLVEGWSLAGKLNEGRLTDYLQEHRAMPPIDSMWTFSKVRLLNNDPAHIQVEEEESVSYDHMMSVFEHDVLQTRINLVEDLPIAETDLPQLDTRDWIRMREITAFQMPSQVQDETHDSYADAWARWKDMTLEHDEKILDYLRTSPSEEWHPRSPQAHADKRRLEAFWETSILLGTTFHLGPDWARFARASSMELYLSVTKRQNARRVHKVASQAWKLPQYHHAPAKQQAMVVFGRVQMLARTTVVVDDKMKRYLPWRCTDYAQEFLTYIEVEAENADWIYFLSAIDLLATVTTGLMLGGLVGGAARAALNPTATAGTIQTIAGESYRKVTQVAQYFKGSDGETYEKVGPQELTVSPLLGVAQMAYRASPGAAKKAPTNAPSLAAFQNATGVEEDPPKAPLTDCEIVAAKIRKNLVKVQFPGRPPFSAWSPGGRILYIPNHYFIGVSTLEFVLWRRFRDTWLRYDVSLPTSSTKKLKPNSEIRVVSLGLQGGQDFPDLGSLMIPSAGFMNMTSAHGLIRVGPVDRDVPAQAYPAPTYRESVSITHSGADYLIKEVVSAVGVSQSGDCGEIYMTVGGPLHGKIAGMHIAFDGDFYQIIGAALVQEQWESVKSALTGPQRDGFQMPASITFQSISEEDNTLTKGYLRVRGKIVYPVDQDIGSSHTPYRKMPTNGVLGKPPRIPTPLSPHQVLNGAYVVESEYQQGFYERLVTKVDRPTTWVEDDLFDQAANLWGDRLRETAQTEGHFIGVLSIDDALNQSAKHPGSKSVEIDTGVGYELRKLYPGKTGKSGVLDFTYDDEMDGKKIYHIRPEATKFLQIFENRTALAKIGKIPPTSLWSMKIKPDELRPTAKAGLGKARTIMMGPYDYTLLATQYFGALRNSLVEQPWMRSLTAMGLDPMEEWASVGHEIRKSHGVFGVDYTNYDDSQPSQTSGLLTKMCRAFYAGAPAEDHLVRDTLIHEACHTTFVFRDHVYTTDHGNPSGFPAGLTTIINSLINVCMFLVAWTRETGLPMWMFFVCCFLITLGDDALCGVYEHALESYPDLAEKFNRLAVARLAAELGMVATDANKSSDLTPFDRTCDASFLKRTFEFHWDFGTIPMIDPQTIQGLLDFRSRRAGSPQVLVNLHEAQRFAVCHGFEFFEEVRDAILSRADLLEAFGITPSDIWEWSMAQAKTFPPEWFRGGRIPT